MKAWVRGAVVSLALAAPALQAATIVIQNNDGAGEGLNDPAAPPHGNQIGNNPGTTLGELRMNLLNAVAARWGALLNSSVTITIGVTFDPLDCFPNAAVLGQASTNGTHANFPGTPIPNVAFHAALADSLDGTDLNGGSVELVAVFNSTVDTNDKDCLGGGGFYYGTDGNAPDGTARLYPTALHEFAHGLGFSALWDPGTGAFTGAGGFPDAYSYNLFDLDTILFWDEMNNAGRLASATNDPWLVWGGAEVTDAQADWLDPAPEVEINAPAGIVGVHAANLGAEPTIVMPQGGVTAAVVNGDDEVANPCAQEIPAPDWAGLIAVFEEPAGCFASFPAYWAQTYGAAGVIISSPDPQGLPDMSGEVSNQEVTIPYVGVPMAVGDDLRANIGTANATIRNSPVDRIGATDGLVRMHAPAVLQPGSSVGHWTSEARRSLLMQPSLGDDLPHDEVDLTLPAFFDMGWSVNLSPIIFMDSFETPAPPP